MGESFEGKREQKPAQLVVPLRFGFVQANLYRGSYPRPHNFRFLRQLKLKTIISVTPESVTGDSQIAAFAKEHGIDLVHVECAAASSKSKKKRGVTIEYSTARKVVEYMLNADMAPMYVHCLNGAQVTCLLIACLRKLSFWTMASIADEFCRYGDMETADTLFIENFRAEIAVPENPVPWIWKGLSKMGVVKNHPTLKITDKEPPNVKLDDILEEAHNEM